LAEAFSGEKLPVLDVPFGQPDAQHLRDLLLQRHTAQKILDPGFHGLGRVAVERLLVLDHGPRESRGRGGERRPGGEKKRARAKARSQVCGHLVSSPVVFCCSRDAEARQPC
jgi:hypothetical protein